MRTFMDPDINMKRGSFSGRTRRRLMDLRINILGRDPPREAPDKVHGPSHKYEKRKPLREDREKAHGP